MLLSKVAVRFSTSSRVTISLYQFNPLEAPYADLYAVEQHSTKKKQQQTLLKIANIRVACIKAVDPTGK